MCPDVDPDFGLVPVSLKSLENTKTNPDILHLGCASVWCVSLIQLCCLPLSLCRRAAVVIRQFVLKLPPPDLPDGLPPIDGIVGLYTQIYLQPRCMHTPLHISWFRSMQIGYQSFISF